jgi:hypothetical protein
MYTHAHRLASAIEVTLWLVLLLILGAVQPATQEFGSRTLHWDPFIGMTQPQSSVPQYLRRPPLLHMPRREW